MRGVRGYVILCFRVPTTSDSYICALPPMYPPDIVRLNPPSLQSSRTCALQRRVGRGAKVMRGSKGSEGVRRVRESKLGATKQAEVAGGKGEQGVCYVMQKGPHHLCGGKACPSSLPLLPSPQLTPSSLPLAWWCYTLEVLGSPPPLWGQGAREQGEWAGSEGSKLRVRGTSQMLY